MTAVDAPGSRLDESLLTCRTIEETVCEVWRGVLRTPVGPYDDFFDLGGDSLSIIDTVDELRARGIAVRTSVALRNPTPARLAEHLTVGNERAPAPGRAVFPELLADTATGAGSRWRARSWAEVRCHPTPVGTGGADPPLFLLHSESHARPEREAAATWPAGRRIIGLPAPGVRDPLPPDAGLAGLVERYLDAVLAAAPHGPYLLAGFGYRAVVAYEVARALRGRGHQVALVAMILPPAPGPATGLPTEVGQLLDLRCTALARRMALGGPQDAGQVLTRLREADWYDDGMSRLDVARAQLAWAELASEVHRHRPGGYDGPVVLCLDGPAAPAVAEAWGAHLSDARVHLFEYGLESPAGVLADARLGAILHQELAR
ncbi:thioesterase domain-containing protein [Solwaraspora sp. WMMD1047]|uniref:phosphopantetheine-binding protein n=1 Tax=Solwaraspora sp. WMMD1047 TaxID=3016102 RepID=UPI002416025F|nr:phosphopantetheine-binding protein [Solwaraspora sp. WMMD1047]MDG4830676.1 thioesterase domain-containing protein [Solwaraspora sp. WMMD1047]